MHRFNPHSAHMIRASPYYCFIIRVVFVLTPTSSPSLIFPILSSCHPHVCPQLNASGLLGNTELSVGSAIACFLAQEGADINYANHKGKSPLDLVADSGMLQLIKSFSEKHR